MRGLVRSGRLSRLQIEIPDQPGVLGQVTTIVGRAGANIVEILHQRMFLDVPAKSAELEVVMETYDHDHVQRVIEALDRERSEEHTSELQSLMRISYAVFCLKKKKTTLKHKNSTN